MNLIKLELDVTPRQLTLIGQVLSGDMVAVSTAAAATVTVEDMNDALTEAHSEGDIDADTSHIEATIPVSQGGTMTEAPPPPASTAGEAFAEKPAPAAEVTVTPPAGNLPPNTTTQTAAVTPAASATAAAPPPPATGEIELGKGQNGQDIPWDVRIHGKAKKTNADGTWRLIQGVDRVELVPSVEAELVAALAASPKPASTAIESSDAPPPPAAASTTVEDVAPPANAPTTFPELLPLVTAAKAAGTLTDEKIAEVCAELGLPQFGNIATRPDLIPKAAELLGV